MLVRQTKNTFIRYYDGEGYIMNQMTRHDRIYNETGTDFLREISRTPTDVNVIVDHLSALYGNSVSREQLFEDFISFVLELEKFKFLVTGDSEVDCDSKDLGFSYSSDFIKTNIVDFTQETSQDVSDNTCEFMLEADANKPHLKSIQFELTSRCNERCIHCYIPNAKKNVGKDISYKQFCNILDQFSEMGGFHVSLSGGEVFLHKDIVRMIQYCRKKDMEICVLTNLISLKDEQIPLIKEANVSYIQTSLYSMDPNVHDTITTVKGSQNRTLEALKKLIDANIPVQISCPLMKANKNSYLGVMQFAREHKIKAFSDYILMGEADLSTENLKNRLSVEETMVVIRDLIENDINYPRWVNDKRKYVENINYETYAKQPLCGVGLNNLCITADGGVYPCPGWQSMIVGNVNNNSLKFIWENSQELARLRSIKHEDFPKCIRCEARKFCTLCLERNCNENNGDMLKIGKHLCDVAFAHKKIFDEYSKKGLL